MRTNLALLLAALICIVATGELTIRTLQHYEQLPNYAKGIRDQSASHVLAPKYTSSSNEYLFIEHDVKSPGINMWGTRDPVFTRAKNPSTFRIAVIGDSVSFGYGLPYEQTYPYLLQSILLKSLPASGPTQTVEVLNFSVSGYGLVAYQALYTTKVRDFYPDLVLIGYVQNDIAPTSVMVQSVGDSMKASGLRKKIARVSQFAAWIYEQAGVIGGKLAFFQELQRYQRDDVLAQSKELLGVLQQQLARDGTPALLIIFPYFLDFADYPLHKVHQVLGQFLQQQQFPLCDLLPAYTSSKAELLRLAPADYVHPNAAANGLAAGAIYHCMQQYNLTPFSAAHPTDTSQ